MSKRPEFPDLMPVVVVDWIDSCHFASMWTEREEAQGKSSEVSRLRCRSVGYLLHDGKESLTLVQSFGASGHVTDGMTIPRVAVRSVRVIEKGSKL